MKIKNSITVIIIAIVAIGLGTASFFLIKSDKNNNSNTSKVESESVKEEKAAADNSVTLISESRSKKQNKKEALYENMSLQSWFPEVDWEESEKIGNELSEEERTAQVHTVTCVGYKKLTQTQSKALLEVRKDYRDRLYWMPYKELLAIEVIKPANNRITLEEARQIVDKTNSFDEALERFIEIQKIPDELFMGEDYSKAYIYWLNDDGSKTIELYAGFSDNTDRIFNGEKKIVYVEKEFIEESWIDSESEILAEYDEELNKIEGREYERVKYKNNKTPKFEPRYDNEESEKIYNELNEEQRAAQKDTKEYVGYKRLTDEQYKALSDIDKESIDTEKKLILKKLAAIKEADPDRRLTLEHVKSVILGIDDIESYKYNDVILMISEELIKEKYYPDIFQKYYFDEEVLNVTMKNESSQAWYWLDDKGSECIVITFGKSVVYGKMNNGELEVLETLYEKKVEPE